VTLCGSRPKIDRTGLAVIVATKKNLNEAGLGFGIIQVQPNVKKVLEIVRLSKHLNVFALAWCMAQSGITSVISGASKLSHLEPQLQLRAAGITLPEAMLT
jgi:aryl-alcohol dehydrogenase-like predicted oxidoreductase